jgi:predicted metalloprotease with PDZ domain
MRAARRLLFAVSLAAALVANLSAQPSPVLRLTIDATRAAANIFRATETIPAVPGPLTLLYPKWIPGEHGPTGPIVDSTGLRFTASGQAIPWRRDDVDMYAYHLTVPQGADTVEVSMEFDAPVAGEGGFSAGASSTAKMAVLSWNWLVLYPAGLPVDRIVVQPSLRIPAGWNYGTALREGNSGIVPGQGITFQRTSLDTLIDSPVIMGEYYRRIPLTTEGEARPAEMNIAADSAAALQMLTDTERQYRNLVAEAGQLFGARHYRDYHFLLSLSDHVAHFGLEHHESNDSRVDERSLVDPSKRKLMAGLLPHEYVHSWCGKYRRPAGLATPDYAQPMKGELLWVYEGLTSYYGDVLTARSGLLTAAQAREVLAGIGAELTHQPGREWRALVDTTIAAQVLYNAPRQWGSWRRGVDFYDEGVLLWLEADTTIRRVTRGQKSLDDWARVFFGPPDQPLDSVPAVKPYTFDELVASMNQVVPYDWARFWSERLNRVGNEAPTGGIENSGWRLDYGDEPTELFSAAEGRNGGVSLAYSLGLMVTAEGRIVDAIPGMPAFAAGITPGMTIVAVNGRKFTTDGIRDAVASSKTSTEHLQLLVENNDYFATYAIDYHGGARYPRLVRDESKPDLLGDIYKPRR